MQNETHNSTDTIRALGSSHEGATSRVRLSVNMTGRLGQLAQWRINPSRIKFPKGALGFEGGYAIVSRALLSSPSDDDRDQVVESNLGFNNRTSNADGDNHDRAAEGSDQKGKTKEDQVVAKGQNPESDGETSGWRKAVAVKKMKVNVKTPDELVRVLGLTLREAEFLVKLSHENIIKMEGFVEDVSKEMIWLVFPWEEHGTLKTFVGSKDWGIPERISLVYDVSAGVEYLHSRNPPIYHGDLKSINILVNSKCHAVITDFGSARHSTTEGPCRGATRAKNEVQHVLSPEATFCPSTNTITLTRNNYTLRWAAPELLVEGEASLAGDIWAFGCVIYEPMVIPDSAGTRLRLDPSSIKFPKDTPEIYGSYAIVSRALLDSSPDDTRDKVVERKAVAVKKMKVGEQDDIVRVLGLALREARFLVTLSHENIVKLEGFIEDVSKEVIWLVFPWEDHGVLKNFVALHDWEIPERISLIFDVARGVEYLHSREPPIVHGDLKSINVLVNSKYRAVITDFGSAYHPVTEHLGKSRKRTIEELKSAALGQATLRRSDNAITLTGKAYTVRWAAPELLKDDQGNLASDIWALGWVAYEIMTNNIPFHGMKEAVLINRIVRGDLPSISNDARMMLVPALCSVLRQCWNLNPSERPAAEDCRESIGWIPMITPNPVLTEDATGFVDRSGELLMRLGNMYQMGSDYPNASKHYAMALGVYTDLADSKGKANAVEALANMQRLQQEYNQAVKSYSEALKIYTNIGDRRGRAFALWGLAAVHQARSEYSEAITFYSESLQIRTDIGDKHGRASDLSGLASVHRLRNEYSQAVAFYSESLQIRTDIGDRRGRADALLGLAEVYRARNEYREAVEFYTESLQIQTQIGNRRGRADALLGLAEMHRLRNEYSQAVAFYSASLQIRTDIGDRRGRADALLGLAEVHRARNECRQAVILYFKCLQIRIEIGDRLGSAEALRHLAGVLGVQEE